MLYRGVVLKSGPFLRGGKSPQPTLELPRSWLSAPRQVSFSFVAVYQSHIVLLSQRPRRGREEEVRLSLRNQANADLVLVPATVTQRDRLQLIYLSHKWSGLPGRMLPSAFQLVSLKFIRSYVAAGFVLLVGTRHTALIGFQQIAFAVSAATRVTSINRRAAGE